VDDKVRDPNPTFQPMLARCCYLGNHYHLWRILLLPAGTTWTDPEVLLAFGNKSLLNLSDRSFTETLTDMTVAANVQISTTTRTKFPDTFLR
jgi:hypothetical protein